MSYEEARLNRRRKRKNENLSMILGLLQGIGGAVMQKRNLADQRSFEMEKIQAQGDIQKAVARIQKEGTSLYGSNRMTLTEADAARVLEEYGGMEGAQAALSDLKQRYEAGDEGDLEPEIQTLTRSIARNKTMNWRFSKNEQTRNMPKPGQEYMTGAQQRAQRGSAAPAGPQSDQGLREMLDPATMDLRTFGPPNMKPATQEEWDEIMGKIKAQKAETQKTGGMTSGAAMPPGSVGQKGTPGQRTQQQLAYDKLTRAFQALQNPDPNVYQPGYMILQQAFGNVFPELMTMPGGRPPKPRFSGMGTTNMPR